MKTTEVANKQKLTDHLMQHVWMKYGNKKRASFNTWIMHSQQISKPNATNIDNTLTQGINVGQVKVKKVWGVVSG